MTCILCHFIAVTCRALCCAPRSRAQRPRSCFQTAPRGLSPSGGAFPVHSVSAIAAPLSFLGENSEEILCGGCRSFSADPSVWKAWSTQSTPALSKPRLDKKLSPSALADFFRASLLVGNSEEIPHAYCPLSGLSLRGPARGRGNLAGSFRIFEDPRRIRNMVPESPTPLRSLE